MGASERADKHNDGSSRQQIQRGPRRVQWRFLWHVVSDHWDQSKFIPPGEKPRLRRRYAPGVDAVAAPLKYDRRHGDRRLLRERGFHGLKNRIARGIAETVAIRMNDHIDEIGVFEGNRRTIIGRIIEFPVRGP